ncbi:DUF2867 domain-containing protein [Notoacmeibacter sp. MSK16QG-6]|uniref:DUF2867 domain-containing protein n=1 Tax=Notoacmeibacter sp. MSK16QG-6 TaxID=2957982 RepID=UPI00209F3A75|nr:DUF2867 domain-containing protein [Notoacmeibacter sp. MSK16QG-6]MCP1199303.1 DUF2867 domain-containing protein [Notoacmeibacter sp. MSK16QG-6]
MSHSRIVRASLPKGAHICSRVSADDFLDGYRVSSPLDARTAASVGLDMPVWAKGLLRLRNMLVGPLGLKTEPEESAKADRFGMFPVRYENENEIVLGFDDKHLDFRITLYRQSSDIIMSTWVRPHNWLGRAYLAAVMPFHVLITRDAMRRIRQAG